MPKMIELMERFDLPEMFSRSCLDRVHFFKSRDHIPRTPLIYTPGIFIVAQGLKKGYLPERVFQYDANNYLVTSVPIPFECETFASREAPFLGLYIDIDMPVLHELLGLLGESEAIAKNRRALPLSGVGPAKMDEEMYDAVCRLLKCLQSETEARIIGPGVLKEILYRVLCGTQASSLVALTTHTGNLAGVSKVLKLIHNDYGSKIDIDQMSGLAGMSVSTFHRAFKEVTSDSPVQYLKKIRLNKARDFIQNEKMKAYIAADKVGYESISQFSREFKRYFGQSPADLAKESRSSAQKV